MFQLRVASYSLLAFLLLPLTCSSQSRGLQDSHGPLSGRVVIDGENLPASQLRVELRLLGENWRATAVTNREGDFTIAELGSGTYFVTVDAPGFEPYEETVQIDPGTPPLVLRLRRTSHAPASSTAASVSARELRIPEKARKPFIKGSHLLKVNDAAGGIAEFQRAIHAFPDFYEAYYKIGIAELKLDHGSAAETAFRKSIELSEDRYTPAQSALSLLLSAERKFAEAESVARVDLQLDPGDATGYYALGLALSTTGSLAEAEKSALQAIQFRPAFAEAYLLLAQIHQHQSNPIAVVADLDAYLKLDPDSPRSAKVKSVRSQTQNILLQQAAGAALAKADP
jgi:tetratricopeptide (TPR) repeat protein